MIHLIFKSSTEAKNSGTITNWAQKVFWPSFFLHPPLLLIPFALYYGMDVFYFLPVVWVLSFIALYSQGFRAVFNQSIFMFADNYLAQILERKKHAVAQPTAAPAPVVYENPEDEPLRILIGKSAGWMAQKEHQSGLSRGYLLVQQQNDLCQNTIIFGGIGSGKTVAGINRFLDLLMCRDHISFLIFDIKCDFMHEAGHFANKYNRDMTIIGDGGVGFNLLGDANPALAASWLKACFSITGQGKGGDGFWTNSATDLAQNILNILYLTKSKYSLYGLYNCVFKPAKLNAAIDEVLANIENLSERDQMQVAESIEWLKDTWGKTDEKVQKSVTSTLATLLSPFANVDLRLGFCSQSENNAKMSDLINNPSLFFVNLPQTKYGAEGSKLTYFLIKLAFMNCMRSRRSTKEWNQTRPVVFLCDEYQSIIDETSDLDFWDKSRSSKTIGIVSMQGVSSLYAKIGNKTTADAILQNFRNRWLFETEDIETINQTVRLVGQHDVIIESNSDSTGSSYSQGDRLFGGKEWQETGYSSGSSTSASITKEDIISAAELRSMPKFHAFFTGKGGDGITTAEVFFMEPYFINE